MEVYNTIVQFFQDGGVFMYPIVIVFVLGAAIAIERYTYLSFSKTTNRGLWKKLMPVIEAGNYKQALAMTARSKAAIGKILTYGRRFATLREPLSLV